MRDRLLFSRFRLLALLIQATAAVCLMPINQRGYASRVAAFVALSGIAWLLNLRCRQTNEYRRRVLARHQRSERRQEFLSSVLATAFAVSAIVYLQFLPIWPAFAGALLLGGSAGYALTTV
jgi:hypothetical protein